MIPANQSLYLDKEGLRMKTDGDTNPTTTDGDTNPTWWQGLTSSLKTQTATWLVAFLISILGLFSGKLTESIKFGLNRADLRTNQYDELATEISQYIFSAELTTKFIGSRV